MLSSGHAADVPESALPELGYLPGLTHPSLTLRSVAELHAGRVDPQVGSGRVHAVLVKTKNCLLRFTVYTILNMFHVV